jgi:hypothetical protein
MDYTAQLNAHESAPVRNFVDQTIRIMPNMSLKTPAPMSAKFNNLYDETPENYASTELQTRNGSPFGSISQTYNFKT